MASLLVVVEAGCDSARAVQHVIRRYRQMAMQVYLLSVQPPMHRHVSRFISSEELKKFHEENGMRELKPVIDRLDAAGVPHWSHVLVGPKAEEIVRFAQECHSSQIIVAKEHAGILSKLGLGSTSSQVRQLIGASGTSAICEVY